MTFPSLRTYTILTVISTLGGAYTSGMTIYLFCFGINRKSPYGFTYKISSIRKSLDSNTNLGKLTAGQLKEKLGISNTVTDGTLALFLLHEFVLDMTGLEQSVEKTLKDENPDIEQGIEEIREKA